MTEATDKARDDFQAAWAAISRCLAADTVEKRERCLANAYTATPVPASLAFVMALISIVADRQVAP